MAKNDFMMQFKKLNIFPIFANFVTCKKPGYLKAKNFYECRVTRYFLCIIKI